jgi:hypothetical protein
MHFVLTNFDLGNNQTCEPIKSGKSHLRKLGEVVEFKNTTLKTFTRAFICFVDLENLEKTKAFWIDKVQSNLGKVWWN